MPVIPKSSCKLNRRMRSFHLEKKPKKNPCSQLGHLIDGLFISQWRDDRLSLLAQLIKVKPFIYSN